MANAEDLNRLTSCSLVLLSHVFLSIGNSKESMNMVTPAMQLASKIPDIHVQLWGSAILKDLHRMLKEPALETEAYNNHCNFSQNLIADQLKCTKFPEHTLISWIQGDPPLPIMCQEPPEAPPAAAPQQQQQQQTATVVRLPGQPGQQVIYQ